MFALAFKSICSKPSVTHDTTFAATTDKGLGVTVVQSEVRKKPKKHMLWLANSKDLGHLTRPLQSFESPIPNYAVALSL